MFRLQLLGQTFLRVDQLLLFGSNLPDIFLKFESTCTYPNLNTKGYEVIDQVFDPSRGLVFFFVKYHSVEFFELSLNA